MSLVKNSSLIVTIIQTNVSVLYVPSFIIDDTFDWIEESLGFVG